MTEPTASAPTASDADRADPFAQAKYQLRFDWGFAGARAVASDADVVVWVDAVPPLAAPAEDQPSVATALAASVAADAAIIEGGLTNATATARWILDEQVRLGRRAMVSIIAAGEPRPGGGDPFRRRRPARRRCRHRRAGSAGHRLHVAGSRGGLRSVHRTARGGRSPAHRIRIRTGRTRGGRPTGPRSPRPAASTRVETVTVLRAAAAPE